MSELFERVWPPEVLEAISRPRLEELWFFNTCPFQRAYSQAHEELLWSDYQRGLFREAHIALVEHVANGQPIIFMANGQHSVGMMRAHGVSLPCIISKYKTRTEEGLRALMGTFDQPEGTRTLRDQLTVAAAGAEGELYGRPLISLLTGAHRFLYARGLRDTDGIARRRRADRLALAASSLDELAWLASIITGESMRRDQMGRVPLIAAMLQTRVVGGNPAATWWSKFRDGVNLTNGEPVKALRDWYLSISRKRSEGGGAGEREVYARSITAWNAERRGEQVKQLKYYRDRPLPEAI